MKKRWRIKSRQSGDPAASSDLSGEEASAAAATPDRTGGDNLKQQQRSEGGDRSPSPGEEIAVRPKRRRKKENRRLSDAAQEGKTTPSGRSGVLRCVVDGEELAVVLDLPQHEASRRSGNLSQASNRFVDLQAAGDASATPATGKKKGKPAGYKTRQKKSSPSDPTGKSNVGGVEVSCGIELAWRPKQQRQLSSDQPANNRDGDVQVAGEASAAPPREEEIIHIESLQPTWDMLKEDCLDDTKLLMDQSVLHASHSSSRSVEAPEEASFDEDETSTLLKVEKKNNSKPYSGDPGEVIAQDEDERHSDKIGVHAIEDHKQEQGGAGGFVQALLDLDDDTISEKTTHYFKQLNSNPPEDHHYWPEYEPDQLTKVNEQLALYRIRAYQLSVDQRLAQLDDENLKKHYPPDALYDEGYFKYYEDSLEWYFDPELCQCPGIDDYQRLVLHDKGEYQDWVQYHLTRNTYEKDLAYVQYRAALANELKWVEDCFEHSAHQWKKIRNVAFLQALKIGAGFRGVSRGPVFSGFHEHLWSIQFDHFSYKGLDGVYFEIWKRVAKLKMNFRAALLELLEQDMFPLRSFDIKHELENTQYRRLLLKDKYDAHVARIGDMVSEDEARQLIKEAVIKMTFKPKTYLDYAMKKLEIAEDIGMISKVRRPERISPQRREDDSEAKLAVDN